MSVSISNLFQTPMIVDLVPDATRLAADLLSAIGPSLETRRAGVGGRDPIDRFADVRASAAMDLIRDHAVMLAQAFTQDVRSPQRSRFRWQTQCWVAVADVDEAVPPLRCYDAFWIADYFVDDGFAEVPGSADGGEVVIEDPRLPMPMAEVPHIRLRTTLNPKAPAYEPEVRIRPATGRMVLYPAWLRVSRLPVAKGRRSVWLSFSLTAVRGDKT